MCKTPVKEVPAKRNLLQTLIAQHSLGLHEILSFTAKEGIVFTLLTYHSEKLPCRLGLVPNPRRSSSICSIK